jgi:hypothetical protein
MGASCFDGGRRHDVSALSSLITGGEGHRVTSASALLAAEHVRARASGRLTIGCVIDVLERPLPSLVGPSPPTNCSSAAAETEEPSRQRRRSLAHRSQDDG